MDRHSSQKLLLFTMGILVGFLVGYLYSHRTEEGPSFRFGQKVTNGYCVGYVAGIVDHLDEVFYKLDSVTCTNGTRWVYIHEKAENLIPIN